MHKERWLHQIAQNQKTILNMIISNEIEYICKNSDPPPRKQRNVKMGDLTLPFSVNDRKGKRTAEILRHNQQAQSNENA